VGAEEIETVFNELTELAKTELLAEGLPEDQLQFEKSLDICYTGQSSTLNIGWIGKLPTEEKFHQLHSERYGFSLARELEFVNLRVRCIAAPRVTDLNTVQVKKDAEKLNEYIAQKVSGKNNVPVFKRESIYPGQTVEGPAIITELCATTYLEAGWQARRDEFGNLRLTRQTDRLRE
jgi:N-methylhydantoinase A